LEKDAQLMAEGKDYLGEKLRLVERAREDAFFRKLDQELIDKMRQQSAEEVEEATRLSQVFRSILVPVDFSSYSTKALLYAADLAERFGSSIIVLHVIAREVEMRAAQHRLRERGGTSDISSERLESAVIHDREDAYTDLQLFLPPRLAKYEVELRVVVGQPFERILETTLRENVDLIVLGSHGRTGLSHVIMGSIAERIARLAPCPVMMVKAPTPEEESWLQEFYETFLPPKP
jgi:nucleotide-binding universal stress UspA family protein